MWKCPACGEGDAQPTHHLTATEAALSFVRPWVDQGGHDELAKCIQELWGADAARLVRCGHCGLRSADPFVGGNAHFYALAFGRESVHPYPASRWEFQLTQSLVASSTGTVLEIGAGDGAFQRRLIHGGIDPARLHATEFNESACRELRELGVRVDATDFRELGPAEHAVVCGHQVFEHLGNLDETFDAFDRLTATGGVVAVSVPNGTNMQRTEDAGGLIDMPPTHVSTWVFKAFHAIAHRHGWTLVDYREEPISRIRAAKELAISRTLQGRMRSQSFPALVERRSSTPRARFALTAVAAMSKFPSALFASGEPHGGVLWAAFKRKGD